MPTLLTSQVFPEFFRNLLARKPVAAFLFLSEDWSPWIALVRMRERWPGLRFNMTAGYLHPVQMHYKKR